jgi:hypothetical protein
LSVWMRLFVALMMIKSDMIRISRYRIVCISDFWTECHLLSNASIGSSHLFWLDAQSRLGSWLSVVGGICPRAGKGIDRQNGLF